MRSLIAALVVVGGVVAAPLAFAQNASVPATGTDVYHVHFAKAAPGQAAALGQSLMEPDKTSSMPTHFIVLRHQEGDDWDYVVVQHLGAKAEVTATAPPPADGQRALYAWHSDTFVSGPSWGEFTKQIAGETPGAPGRGSAVPQALRAWSTSSGSNAPFQAIASSS